MCVCVCISVCVYLWRTRVGFRVQGFRTHAYTRTRARMHAPHMQCACTRVCVHTHTHILRRAEDGVRDTLGLGFTVYGLHLEARGNRREGPSRCRVAPASSSTSQCRGSTHTLYSSFVSIKSTQKRYQHCQWESPFDTCPATTSPFQ